MVLWHIRFHIPGKPAVYLLAVGTPEALIVCEALEARGGVQLFDAEGKEEPWRTLLAGAREMFTEVKAS